LCSGDGNLALAVKRSKYTGGETAGAPKCVA
jgi:hypothetical protein